MNALVEFEAGILVDLFNHGDDLNIRMFMEKMNIPLDVQDKLVYEISLLTHRDQHKIAQIIESHGQSTVNDKLNY